MELVKGETLDLESPLSATILCSFHRLDLLANFVRRCFLGNKTEPEPDAILAIPST